MWGKASPFPHEALLHASASRPAPVAGPRASTSLLCAARHNQAEVMAALLAHGADPSRTFASGATPLVFCAERGHAECVSALLASGRCGPAGLEVTTCARPPPAACRYGG